MNGHAAREFERNSRDITNRTLDVVGRAVGIELLGRIVRATPVDTGRARGNWNVSIGREDPTTNDERRAAEALEEGNRVINEVKLGTRGDRVFITNGLPYIGPLNDGHSKQAPKGYLQRIVRDMRSYVRKIATAAGLRVR